jgi:hypothetical protein
MDIRNILHKKEENKTKKVRLIVLIIFCLGIAYIIGMLVYKDKAKTNYFLWEELNEYGTLEVHNNYPLNTHKLITENGIFWLISSTLNINNFLDDKIEVHWYVSNITKEFPIIEIDNISIPDKNVKVKNNIYSFTNELVYLDFSQEKEFYATKNGQTITIYHQNSPVIEIETFFCSKITHTQNCEELIESYKNNDNEFFASYWWNVFYKIEENKRAAFNDNTLWYIIKVTDEDLLLNMSHLINIIDTTFIANSKKDFILTNCMWEDVDPTVWAISEVKKEVLDSDLIKLEITLSDLLWNTNTCKLNIDVYDDRSIKNKSIQ